MLRLLLLDSSTIHLCGSLELMIKYSLCSEKSSIRGGFLRLEWTLVLVGLNSGHIFCKIDMSN